MSCNIPLNKEQEIRMMMIMKMMELHNARLLCWRKGRKVDRCLFPEDVKNKKKREQVYLEEAAIGIGPLSGFSPKNCVKKQNKTQRQPSRSGWED